MEGGNCKWSKHLSAIYAKVLRCPGFQLIVIKEKGCLHVPPSSHLARTTDVDHLFP